MLTCGSREAACSCGSNCTRLACEPCCAACACLTACACKTSMLSTLERVTHVRACNTSHEVMQKCWQHGAASTRLCFHMYSTPCSQFKCDLAGGKQRVSLLQTCGSCASSLAAGSSGSSGACLAA